MSAVKKRRNGTTEGRKDRRYEKTDLNHLTMERQRVFILLYSETVGGDGGGYAHNDP